MRIRVLALCLLLAGAPAPLLAAPRGPSQAVAAQSKTDRNDEAAAEIRELLARRFGDPRFHRKTADLLSALGASAGFGCQMAIREAFIKTGRMKENNAFIIVGTADGAKFYFGDFLNGCLLGPQSGKPSKQRVSVWSLIAGAAQHAGATRYPNVGDIVRENARSTGSKAYGIPRLAPEQMPEEMPVESLRAAWPAILRVLESKSIDPRYWGWISASAAQQVIVREKERFDPAMAARVFMESAIPMAHIDAARVGIEAR